MANTAECGGLIPDQQSVAPRSTECEGQVPNQWTTLLKRSSRPTETPNRNRSRPIIPPDRNARPKRPTSSQIDRNHEKPHRISSPRETEFRTSTLNSCLPPCLGESWRRTPCRRHGTPPRFADSVRRNATAIRDSPIRRFRPVTLCSRRFVRRAAPPERNGPLFRPRRTHSAMRTHLTTMSSEQGPPLHQRRLFLGNRWSWWSGGSCCSAGRKRPAPPIVSEGQSIQALDGAFRLQKTYFGAKTSFATNTRPERDYRHVPAVWKRENPRAKFWLTSCTVRRAARPATPLRCIAPQLLMSAP